MDPFQEHFETIKRLYIVEGRTAAKVQETLEIQHNFPKYRKKEFQKRLGNLGLRKNLKNGEWALVGQQLRARGFSKRTGVYINDILVSWPKVSKEIRRAPKVPVTTYDLAHRGRVVVRTPPPLPEETIEVPSHGIRYPDVLEVKEIENILSPWMTSKNAVLQLDQAIENAQLPWGQFEAAFSKLVFGGKKTMLIASSNQLASLGVQLERILEISSKSVTGVSFMRLSTSNPTSRIRFSFDQLIDSTIFSELVGNHSSISIQAVSSPISELSFLIRTIYQLANGLISLGFAEDHRIFLKAILDPARLPILSRLLMMDNTTSFMAWTKLVQLSNYASDKASFRLLLEIGSRLPFLDGATIYHQCYRIACQQEWNDHMGFFLHGPISLKLRQYVVGLERPLDGWEEGSEGDIFIRSCLQGITPMDENPDWIMNEFIRWIFDSDLGLPYIPDHDLDTSCHKFQSRQRRFLQILLGSARCKQTYTQTIQILHQLSKTFVWLHDDFVENSILRGNCYTIRGAIRALQTDAAHFSAYMNLYNFLGQDLRLSFLQSLLSKLIQDGRKGSNTNHAIEVVLVAGADPNYRRSREDVSLFLRVVRSARDNPEHPGFDFKLINDLIRHGASINAQALVQCKATEVRMALAQAVNKKDTQHLPAIAFVSAARHYDYETLRLLLNANLDPNIPNPLRDSRHPAATSTVLGLAISIIDNYVDSRVEKALQMTRFLLGFIRPSQNAQIMQESLRSISDAVISLRHVDRVREVFNFPYGVLSCWTVQKCELLEEYGLDFGRVITSMDWSPALSNGGGEVAHVFRFFVDRGGRVDCKVLCALTSRTGDRQIIQEAIEKCTELDPTLHDQLPRTPLHCAARWSSFQTVEKLVQLGANVNPEPCNGVDPTVLGSACLSDDPEERMKKVKFLVERGNAANYDSIKRENTTLGFACTQRGSLEIVKYLLEQGADPNAGKCRFRPLNRAIVLRDARVVSLLLEHGARANITCQGGHMKMLCSPLDKAVAGGMPDIVSLLLEYGATSQVPGSTGYDGAIRLAEEFGYGAIARLIKEHNACPNSCVE